MIQVEVLLLPKLNLEINIDLENKKNTSLLLKVYILDNKFIVEKKLQLLSEMFYQSIKYQKVPLFLV